MVDVECQLLRDMKPITRPTYWSSGLKSFDPGMTISYKLFPGPEARDSELIVVGLYHAGYSADDWIAVHATFSIDGVPWQKTRPGLVFVESEGFPYEYGGSPSCIIPFQRVTTIGPLAGMYSLLIAAHVVTE